MNHYKTHFMQCKVIFQFTSICTAIESQVLTTQFTKVVIWLNKDKSKDKKTTFMQIISLVYMKRWNINASTHFPTYSQAKLSRNQSWRHLPYTDVENITVQRVHRNLLLAELLGHTGRAINHNSKTTTAIVCDTRARCTIALNCSTR